MGIADVGWKKGEKITSSDEDMLNFTGIGNIQIEMVSRPLDI